MSLRRLLRTHTSPGQMRAMRERCPEPIRVILPGMCYRNEQITTRSSIQFTQVDVMAHQQCTPGSYGKIAGPVNRTDPGQ